MPKKNMIISKICEFFSRLLATIQCLLATDKKSPEDIRRMHVRKYMHGYHRRERSNNMLVPIRTKHVEICSNSNPVLEEKVLEKVIARGTLHHLKEKSYLGRQYYKLRLAATAFDDETFAYAYVQASPKSAVVYLYEPSSKVEPYKAFWTVGDEVTKLKEENTLEFAERILSKVA